jgi:hypothetical protein
MTKLRIGLTRGDREWSLNDGQIPNFRGVRVNMCARVQSCGGKSGVAMRQRERSPETPTARLFAALVDSSACQMHRCVHSARASACAAYA